MSSSPSRDRVIATARQTLVSVSRAFAVMGYPALIALVIAPLGVMGTALIGYVFQVPYLTVGHHGFGLVCFLYPVYFLAAFIPLLVFWIANGPTKGGSRHPPRKTPRVRGCE